MKRGSKAKSFRMAEGLGQIQALFKAAGCGDSRGQPTIQIP